MKTEIVFSVKDEPVLEMIQSEFKDIDFNIEYKSKGKYKEVRLIIDKKIIHNSDSTILLDGFIIQFETIKYIEDYICMFPECHCKTDICEN